MLIQNLVLVTYNRYTIKSTFHGGGGGRGGGELTMDVCNLQALRGFLTEYFSRFTIAVCKEFTVMLSQWRIHSVLQGCHINVQLHSMIYLCIHLHFYIALGHVQACDWSWLSQLCLYNQVVKRCIIWACIISWRSIEMMNENEPYL